MGRCTTVCRVSRGGIASTSFLSDHATQYDTHKRDTQYILVILYYFAPIEMIFSIVKKKFWRDEYIMNRIREMNT